MIRNPEDIFYTPSGPEDLHYGELPPGYQPTSVLGATDSLNGMVGSVQGTLESQAASLAGGATSAILGGGVGGAAIGTAVSAGIMGGFSGSGETVISANPARTPGTQGFSDDRAGAGQPIPGQPQKAKVLMTPLFAMNAPASDYYPLDEGEMNTPRLARGITKNTITEAQSYGLTAVITMKGFKIEPMSPYAAKYPFNTVEESESGHIREVDDTPGAERIKESHRTGTFYEIHPDGGKVTKVVKDNFTAVLGDDSLNVVGSCKIQVTGSCSLFTAQDVDIFATGNPVTTLGINVFSPAGAKVTASHLTLMSTVGPILVSSGADMMIGAKGIITMADVTGVDIGAIDEEDTIRGNWDGMVGVAEGKAYSEGIAGRAAAVGALKVPG